MPGRARPEEQETILAEALARARAGAPRAVAVFDLDSTLLDNRPRMARVLRDYGLAAGLPELLEARPEHWQGWSLDAALARAGLSPAQREAHREPARRFFLEWFFTSAYCRLDVPVPGAAAFVAQLAAEGAQVAYVSGRPASMEPGTRGSLRDHGFPVPDGRRVFLLLKPRRELPDDDWKAGAPALIDRLGPVVAAFDNEPTHVNGYALAWPGALAIHLDTDHSERPVEVLARVPSILDFRRAAAGR